MSQNEKVYLVLNIFKLLIGVSLKATKSSFARYLSYIHKLNFKEKLKKGDQVRILKGPFANFIATVETYEADHRIWVLMNLMGRKTKIQTPSNSLKLSN